MPADELGRSTDTSIRRGPVARRRFMLAGAGLAAAVALAACGDDEGGKGSRDDPFPYQDPRSRNTRL